MRGIALFLAALAWAVCEARAKTPGDEFFVPLKEGGQATVRLSRPPGKDVAVEVVVAGASRRFENLGADFADLVSEGKSAPLQAADFDGDGNSDFFVRTTQPPLVGSLYAFRWDQAAKAFRQHPTATGDRYLMVPEKGVVAVTKDTASFALPGASGGKIWYRWSGKFFTRATTP